MKIKLLLLMIAWTSLSIAAPTPVPDNFKIDCSDGTFKYNKISIEKENNKINIKASGYDLKYFIDSIDPGGEVTLSLDTNDCKISEEGVFNHWEMNCNPKYLTATVRGLTQKENVYIERLDVLTIEKGAIQIQATSAAPIKGYSIYLLNNQGSEIISQICEQ
ncbi:hypothetical protein K2X05_10745 [bacterium]|nr:hypothetical protein [bacterium]